MHCELLGYLMNLCIQVWT